MTVRTQLNLLVAATMSLVLVAFLVPLGVLLLRAAEDRAVAAATLQAQSTAAIVALGQAPADPGTDDEPRITVFYGDGHQVGAPASRTPSVELAARGRAFTAESGGGIEVLRPVQGLPGGTAVVRSYAPASLMRQGVTRTWTILGLLGIVLFGLGVLLADRLGRRLVGSVTALAGTADRLAAGDLTARVPPGNAPEINRVGVELNRLAGRIQELLAAEREEVADLAHRLRTPVTALRLDAESVRDASDRERMVADVDALHRLVDEVIRTARRPVREGAYASADLAEVAADRLAFWSALADDAGRTVRRSLPATPVLVRAAREDLVAALDALLDNVFSHTPDGTPMRVSVWYGHDGAHLTVEDGGPGLTYAGRGESTAGSTGLGLDIARRTAEAAGGSMSIGTSQLGGALVDLLIPFVD
jgi:signal transduction histidine kinase